MAPGLIITKGGGDINLHLEVDRGQYTLKNELDFELQLQKILGELITNPCQRAKETRLAQASTVQLETWAERVLDAPSLTAVFDEAPLSRKEDHDPENP